jgi:hypothetical protein
MAAVALDIRTLVLALVVLAVFVGAAYLLNPSYVGRLFGIRDSFQDGSANGVANGVMSTNTNYKMNATNDTAGTTQQSANMANPNAALSPNQAASAGSNAGSEGYADLSDMEGPAKFGNADAPAGCYPRDQLTPGELLPKDPNSVWAQQNPMGTGSLKGKNFLSAGALIGVNTVGQSLRNANYQMRSEPPNPQVAVSVWSQSTIEPDVNRRSLEIA